MSIKLVSRSRYEIDYRDEHGKRTRITVDAPTSDAAKRMHAELKLDVARRKKGLAAEAPNPQALTVDDLAKWWMTSTWCARLAHPEKARSGVRAMVLGRSLGAKRADVVSAADVDAFLIGLEGEGYGPASVNHSRGFLRTIYAQAMRAGKLRLLQNPVVGSEVRSRPQHDLVTLSMTEAIAVVGAVDDPLRAIYAVAIFAGLRRGEIWALRRNDVDFAAGTITVRSSNARARTKSGRVRVVPIHAELRPHLARQLLAHKLDLVFPSPVTGRMRSADAKTSRTLKTALVAAGVTRGLRFHDLRHTCATLFLRAGVGLAFVQRLLGHSSPVVTANLYGHLVVDDLAREMAKLGVHNATTPALALVATAEKNTGGAR